MILELLLGIALAAGALWFVLRPVLHPAASGNGNGEAGNVDEGEDSEEDVSPRAVALRALKEIEFDRATGKLSDADYQSLKQQYTEEALAALRAGSREAGGGRREPEAPPVSRLPSPVCPVHGRRPESDALFCSSCGRRLGSAPGFCARCGAALETEAHYCHSCGARVAA